MPGMGKPSDELLSLRRSLEQEADRMGLDMVIQAGYDPYEAIEIFDNLIEDRGDRPGKERVAAVLQPLATTDFSRTGRSTDRDDFGKRLQALLLEQGWLELRHSRWDGALQCAVAQPDDRLQPVDGLGVEPEHSRRRRDGVA